MPIEKRTYQALSLLTRLAVALIIFASCFNAPASYAMRADPPEEKDYTITFIPGPQPPVVRDIPDQTISEGESFATIPLDAYVNDGDHTDQEITWTYSGNVDLIVTIADRVATIQVPAPGWTGVEAITFTATDPDKLSGSSTAVFTVLPPNQPPVVHDIPDQTITEGESFAILQLDAYVEDNDNTDQEIAWTYSGNVDLIVTIADRVATIQVPAPDWTGEETITFIATDPGQLSDSSTAVFTVLPANQPPTAEDDGYTVDEGATLTVFTPGVLGNDNDPEGKTLTATVVDGPLHGNLTLNANGGFIYSHDGSETTVDSFTYHASDGIDDSNLATVTLTVNPVNDPPVAVNDAYTTTEGTTLTVEAPGVQANDFDAEGDTLTAAVVDSPAHGTLTLNTDGSFSYTHDGSGTTVDSFTYMLNDGTDDSNLATVAITVISANNPPEAKNDTYNVERGATLTVFAPGVLANDKDVEGDSLSALLVTQPAHGTLTFNANGSFIYSHDGSEAATDSFTYQAYDGKDRSNLATVTINVSASHTNNAPVANDDEITTFENESVDFDVLENDDDPDGEILSVGRYDAITEHGGTVSCGKEGTCTYTPPTFYNGQDTFTYTAKDGYGDTANATVLILVIPNPPPMEGRTILYLPLVYR